jgi:hypothetical protein
MAQGTSEIRPACWPGASVVVGASNGKADLQAARHDYQRARRTGGECDFQTRLEAFEPSGPAAEADAGWSELA